MGTYKLTTFEYDLLTCLSSQDRLFMFCPELVGMQRLGYYRAIPSDVRISDLIGKNNAETKNREEVTQKTYGKKSK